MADGADEAAVDAPVRPASVTRASRVATPARRPSYVWAQNVTHAFVTVSLTPEERSGAATPRVAFSAKVVHVSVPAEAADESAQSPPDAVALRLEIYRAVQPAACSWQRTSRGIMIRLRKQARGHWPRLLRAEGHDGKQGVDWARWSHPEADRAEKRDANSDEFHRRNAARHKDIERLRPRFDGMLQEFAAARERDEYLEPQQQVEMLRLGEAILSHYRTERKERTSLLGDAPLPAGVDEEALERALIKLRELERGGELDYNRNTPSWKEFNRRQKLRRAKKRKQLKKQKKRRIGTQLVAVQPVA